MLKIGLTGGIGSGKSYVSMIFRELKIPVYEADREARRLMETNLRLMTSIKNEFGEEAYVNSKLNRKYLADIVFKDTDKLQTLNRMVHPVVHMDFDNWCNQYTDLSYVVEEAAILLETGGAARMDYIIYVKADLETRISRVISRDKVSRNVVLQRISNQGDDSEKEKLADFIIYNENDSMILPQIVDLHNRFLKTE